MKKPINKITLNIKVASAAVLIPLILFTVNQFLLQIFNNAHPALTTRLAYAVQPTIYLLYLTAAVIVVFIIIRQLSPLFDYFKTGRNYIKARKSALKIPWILILVNSGLWLAAITLFYSLQGFSTKGGVPYLWSLLTNSISGSVSAILAALLINRLLIPAKIKLEMTDIREGERDLFIKFKIPLIFCSGFIYTVLAVIYAARFFVISASGGVPPLRISFGMAMVFTVIAGLLPVSLNIILAITEDRIQRQFLLEKMKILTSSNGDLGNKVSLINFDQTGALAAVINTFIDKIRTLIIRADHTGRQIVETSNDIETLLGNVTEAAGTMLHSINKVDEEMNEQEAELNNARNSLQTYFSAINDLTDNIESQAGSVEQTSKAANYIADAIRNEALLVKEIKQQTVELTGMTDEGNAHISDFIESIKVVDTSSRAIEEILEQMKTLTEQIDMLAMNAAIEAAHAGDAGKGFAVVAEEVRRLSENNAEQSEQISAQMTLMMESINDGNRRTESAGNSFRQISANVDKTDEKFNNILNNCLHEEEAASELVTTVNHLVHITDTLKIIAETQQKQNNGMKELIDTVFGRFGSLKDSMKAQRENRNIVNSSLEELKGITEKNLLIVRDLNEILRQFSL